MKWARIFLAVVTCTLGVDNAEAAITPHVTPDASVPGLVQYVMTVDTDTDFLSAGLFVELTAGTVHDPFSGNWSLDGDSLGITTGDTYFTANGTTPGFSGATGELGDIGSIGPILEVGSTRIYMIWHSPGSDTDDIGAGLPLGRFSVSDDAVGAWEMLVGNEAAEHALISGIITPEPVSLGLLGLGGLALLRRR